MGDFNAYTEKELIELNEIKVEDIQFIMDDFVEIQAAEGPFDQPLFDPRHQKQLVKSLSLLKGGSKFRYIFDENSSTAQSPL